MFIIRFFGAALGEILWWFWGKMRFAISLAIVMGVLVQFTGARDYLLALNKQIYGWQLPRVTYATDLIGATWIVSWAMLALEFFPLAYLLSFILKIVFLTIFSKKGKTVMTSAPVSPTPAAPASATPAPASTPPRPAPAPVPVHHFNGGDAIATVLVAVIGILFSVVAFAVLSGNLPRIMLHGMSVRAFDFWLHAVTGGLAFLHFVAQMNFEATLRRLKHAPLWLIAIDVVSSFAPIVLGGYGLWLTWGHVILVQDWYYIQIWTVIVVIGGVCVDVKTFFVRIFHWWWG